MQSRIGRNGRGSGRGRNGRGRQIFNGQRKFTNFDNSLTHSKNAIFSKKKKKGHVENDCLFKGKLQFSIINKIWVC